MTQKTLKEYGLEFINEMAKDREVAQQEIGVVISGTKSNLVAQGAQHFTYQDIDNFIKTMRKESARIIDSELTRITIKSLGRIREVISEGGLILKQEKSPEEEKEIAQLEEDILALKNQIKDKNLELQQIEGEKTEISSQLATKTDLITTLEADVKRTRTQLENQQQEMDVHKQQSEELANELQVKQALIDKLKEQELIHEKDIQNALASVAESYQIQENYYQRMLEEGIQRGVTEARQEWEMDREEMRNKLETITKRSEEAETRHKITLGRLEEALQIAEEESNDLKQKLSEAASERLERNVLLEYTQRLLSTHPLYASILILLNLGGVLDLPTLAMSVGAHPLKLKQMLMELVHKGLITLSNDDPPMISAVMSP
jgi:chromosome segregation ATPase